MYQLVIGIDQSKAATMVQLGGLFGTGHNSVHLSPSRTLLHAQPTFVTCRVTCVAVSIFLHLCLQFCRLSRPCHSSLNPCNTNLGMTILSELDVRMLLMHPTPHVCVFHGGSVCVCVYVCLHVRAVTIGLSYSLDRVVRELPSSWTAR